MIDYRLVALAALDLVQVERARRHFLSFIEYMAADWVEIAAHHKIFATLAAEIISGKKNRAVISVPPRHGKSQFFSIFLPAFALGTDPTTEIILVGHTQDLAVNFSRQVREIIRSQRYQRIFPSVRFATERVDDWRLTRGGGIRAVGVGGGITGRGADLFIIDDPVKEGDERSPARLEETFAWFSSAAMTRLSARGRALIVMTRWHPRDLAGRVLEQGGWDYVRIPAIAEDFDPLGRPFGTPLWPERFPIEKLREIEKLNPHYFQSLYQQDPKPDAKVLFTEDMFKRHNFTPAGEGFWAFDLASTADGDFSVWARCHYLDDTLFISGIQSHHETWPTMMAYLHKTLLSAPKGDKFVFPKDALEIVAVQNLRRDLPSDISSRIISIKARGDKFARAMLPSGWGAGRRLSVQTGHLGDELIRQACLFPADAHDDYVDMLSLAAEYAQREGVKLLL